MIATRTSFSGIMRALWRVDRLVRWWFRPFVTAMIRCTNTRFFVNVNSKAFLSMGDASDLCADLLEYVNSKAFGLIGMHLIAVQTS